MLSVQNFHILLIWYTKAHGTQELSLLTADIKWIEEYAWYRHNDIPRAMYEYNAALWSATEYVNGGHFTFYMNGYSCRYYLYV